MCGICGAMSSWLTPYEVENFKTLMTLSVLRGEYGAGVAAVSRGKHLANILRSQYSSFSLVRTKEFEKLVQKQKSVLLGHARYPTRGEQTIAAVHPHRAGDIVGVHNGTLWKVGNKVLSQKESDSKILFEEIAKVGIDQTVAELRGAYACVWINEREQTISFLRNEERPLYFGHSGYLANPQTLYFASDSRFLDISLRKSSSDSLKIEALPAHELRVYSLKVANEIKPLEVRRVEPPKPVLYSGNYTSWKKDWEDDEGFAFGEKETNQLQLPRTGKVEACGQTSVPSVVNPQPSNNKNNDNTSDTKLLETIKNHFVLPRIVKAYLERGCCYCGAVSDFQEHQKQDILWVSQTQYLCLDCQTRPGVPSVCH